MRGEHILEGTSERVVVGSSPHARGALDQVISDAGAWGIIPACAGSTTQV